MIDIFLITFALGEKWSGDFTSTWEWKSKRLVDSDPKRRSTTV